METFEDKVTPSQLTDEYKEVVGIIPSLHKYKADHNIDNLAKLCVEVAQFCRCIYASTRNEQERKVYLDMLDKLREK